MDKYEFGILCRKYNMLYKELFDTIPCHSEYACSREEFYAALKKAVETKCQIDNYINRAIEP